MIGIAMLAATLVAIPGQAVRAGEPSAPAIHSADPLGHDRKGRPTVMVEVNGRGPFPMVVDTGAQTSLVTPALAAELALPGLQGNIGVRGVTGTAQAGLYGVDRLSGTTFEARNLAMPALVNAGVTDARGIVGMNLFADRKVIFDREAGVLTTAASGPAPPGYVTIKGHRNEAGLLVVPILLDGQQVEALVDSGAQGTIVSPALLEALGWASDDPRLRDSGTMRGAVANADRVRVATIGTMRIGSIQLHNVPVVIASGLSPDTDGKPRAILGSDLLNLLPAYAVDLPLGELQIRLPLAARR